MFSHDERLSPALLREWRDAVAKYSGRPDVIGVAIGHRWKRGKRTKQLCVRVHLAEKHPKGNVPKREMIPAKRRGVCFDVVEGQLPPQLAACATYAQRTSRVDPIRPGFSFGPDGGESGTIGVVVSDAAGNLYGLGARHALYADGARNGDPVIQPGRPDGGRAPADVIGELARYVRDYDAALVLLNDERRIEARPLEGPQLMGVRLPIIGDVLAKSGRATCVTTAYVDAIGRYYGYKGALHLKPVDTDPNAVISEGGDSGAIWYDPAGGLAVGLHVRGDSLPGGGAIATLLAASELGEGALAALKVSLP